MYICSCFAVTDHRIRDLVKTGKVKTWKELVKETNVCTNCGRCGLGAKEIFDEAYAKKLSEDVASGTACGVDCSACPLKCKTD